VRAVREHDSATEIGGTGGAILIHVNSVARNQVHEVHALLPNSEKVLLNRVDRSHRPNRPNRPNRNSSQQSDHYPIEFTTFHTSAPRMLHGELLTTPQGYEIRQDPLASVGQSKRRGGRSPRRLEAGPSVSSRGGQDQLR